MKTEETKNKMEEPMHLRMPSDLKQKLAKRASKENRTISNMVVTILKKALTNY